MKNKHLTAAVGIAVILAMMLTGCFVSRPVPGSSQIEQSSEAESGSSQSDEKEGTLPSDSFEEETSSSDGASEEETSSDSSQEASSETNKGDTAEENSDTAPEADMPEIIELINNAGDIITIYRQDNGKYADNLGTTYVFDDKDTWIGDDHSIWNAAINAYTADDWTIAVEPAIERFLAQVEDYYYYEDSTADYSEQLVFTVGRMATDLTYEELQFDVAEDGSLTCVYKTDLKTIAALTRDDFFVVRLEMPEVMPTRGISFTDMTGTRRMFYITYSGEDGSPLLVEFFS